MPSGPPAQGVEKKKKTPTKPVPATRKEARACLRQFRIGLKKARKSPEDRVRVVEGLVKRSHGSFVKALAGVARKDKSRKVKVAALRSLGRLDFPESRKLLMKTLANKKILDQPDLLVGALDGLVVLPYKPATFKTLKALFEKGVERQDRIPVQRRIISFLVQVKDKQAFPLFLQYLEPPAPADVHDPANPPASYWEMRWKIWQAWKPNLLEGLQKLTGKRFRTAKEFKAWAAKEGKKKGFLVK